MSSNKSNGNLAAMIGALGIVYGDIGTSPLYVLKECFHSTNKIALNETNVIGIISLILWSLFIAIVVKYITFIMKADNEGEGGPMALISLLNKNKKYQITTTIILGLLGAALLFGDGIITPAISVLSAVEGLSLLSPKFEQFVIPITLAILSGLFLIQKFGTEKVGSFFGPITLVWFIAIALLGIPHIISNPVILKAINPYFAYNFFHSNGIHGFVVLGSVLLCITGGEALYADMGHCGKAPITKAWYLIVYPALILNYLGQGSLLLSNPHAVHNPFFNLASSNIILYPLIILATLATIIASQALITGIFSLTQQSINLGYLPRMNILYTSEHNSSQIYIPFINNFLMAGCLSLVLFMKTSSNLAAAYGIAVILTITSILFFLVMKNVWNWSNYKTIPLLVLFLSFDLSFAVANFVKIFHGGYIALSMGLIMFWVMLTWKKGSILIYEQIQSLSQSLADFVSKKPEATHIIDSTGIFMTVNQNFVPFVLLNNIKHNKIMHKQTILLSILTANIPFMPDSEKIRITNHNNQIIGVIAKFGFSEKPEISSVMALLENQGIIIDPDKLSFYLGRELVNTDGNAHMLNISKKLYKLLKTNSQSAPDYFKIPKDKIIEIGGNISI